ncbi:MAG: sodium:alanine symporter family protein [Clostridia bacterium]|nr:sodium:alanine symporter family protein [Clostridia bacterium]
MIIYELIRQIGEVLWGGVGLAFMLGVGVYFTLRLRFAQVRALPLIIKRTLGSLFVKDNGKGRRVSPFSALCTALAASVGVGNIAGVATALTLGGPGAVFWMLVASVLGMATAYAENYLGILYRVPLRGGGYTGGAMYCLRDGVGGRAGKCLGALFAFFCVMASLGMGNMSQVNTLTVNFTSAFGIRALAGREIAGVDLYSVICGAGVCLAAGIAIFAGMGRILRITERVVPFIVILYTLGCIAVLFAYRENLVSAIGSVFKHAFSLEGVYGGVGGYSIREVVVCGVKRGVFSNEAGLGSTVCIGASAEVDSAEEQGMWGMLNVFIDTVVMCTLTALTVLCSGLIDLQSGRMLTDSDSAALVSEVFGSIFGRWGSGFIAVCIVLFAFSTVLGWSVYGVNCFVYLFGERRANIYRAVYVAFIFIGAVAPLTAVWEMSDSFNALMMVPNLMGLIFLRKKVTSLK